MPRPLLLALLLTGCFWIDSDFDDDGVGVSQDCDDRDEGVGLPSTWFTDADGDGYGAGAGTQDCEPDAGSVLVDGDCNDAASTIHPDAVEICDGLDNDCDGAVDAGCPSDTGETDPPESTADTTDTGDTVVVVPTGDTDSGDTDPGDTMDTGGLDTAGTADTGDTDPPVIVECFRDHDGDGHGLTGTQLEFEDDCPLGWAPAGGDCNDTQAAINPGAVDDPGDSTDEDCDGQFNCFVDADDDGFGGPLRTLAPVGSTCTQAPGASTVDTDCDDLAAASYPGSSEICDGRDNDCDGLIPPLEYDTDGDGFFFCAGDCDDFDPNINASVPEDCSNPLVDFDCDGSPTTSSYYEDLDGDGFGGARITTACEVQPIGVLYIGGDCDDHVPNVNPNAAEIVGDAIDQNCDGVLLCFLDADGDTFGTLRVVQNVDSCLEPGFAETATDCDDEDPGVNPGADELIDTHGIDEDCSGSVACYTDGDFDGFGGLTIVDVDECEVLTGGDCDPDRSDVHPGAPELCDGFDNDCNGVVPAFELDSDGDGFIQCTWVGAGTLDAGDCDPTDAAVYPGAAELPGDAIDQDCDGVDHCYVDTDLDNHGIEPAVAGLSLDCSTDDGWASTAGDCNDLDAHQNPLALEVCNGLDDDCDPNTHAGDETDSDGDGYPVCASDCDDDNPAINPGAPEDCSQPVDENCDGELGVTNYWPDVDGDGFGDASSAPELTCTPGAGWVTDASDCNDQDALIHPDATEVRDNDIDENCDGLKRCRVDQDGDHYGTNVNELVETCIVFQGGDCRDADPVSHPGAPEICDGLDNDCVNGVPANELDGDGDLQSACAGDCDDENPLRYANAIEVCDGIDNDCAGGIPANELDSDGDLQRVCAGDCDDEEPVVYTGAPELCDGIKNNCALATLPANELDVDGDQFRVCEGDCDDAAAAVFPGATEQPGSGVDEDCDGLEICYVDLDGDAYGHGEILTADAQCAGAGKASQGGDCNDTVADIHPGAVEICDGIDNDCSGGANFTHPTWGGDESTNADGDPALSCNDCEDTAPGVYPGAVEICGDQIDQNCDGSDEGGLYYTDHDGDGFGDPNTLQVSCTPIVGAVTDGTDCDDTNPAIRPSATETPNNDIDENCDGVRACYPDLDDDGFGAGSPTTVTGPTCETSTTAIVNGDCDDDAPTRFPNNDELCDGLDNDCNSVLLPAEVDSDNDGYVACFGVGDLAGLGGDCAPNAPAIHPGAADAPLDSVDSDCDGYDLCYQDLDGDGQGAGDLVAAPGLLFCQQPGWATTSNDCDDANALAYVGAAEVPVDGVDQDCDGLELCYADADGDSFGDLFGGPVFPSAGLACDALNFANSGEDCDDSNANVNPAATEVVNSIDDDCSGTMLCYQDGDDDGFGSSVQGTVFDCAELGWSTQTGDCNDVAAAINPAAIETSGNDIDEDCNGERACFTDADVDGFGLDTAPITIVGPTCFTGMASAVAGDCDDSLNSVYPNASEICDGRDNDCNGLIPDDEQDDDVDTFVECTGVGPLFGVGDDCDDDDPMTHPQATELPGNSTDEDCDGFLDCYVDLDGDLFGAGVLPHQGLSCDVLGWSSAPGDCDDNASAVNPSAAEVVDAIDNNCDGSMLCYQDGDQDSFGTSVTGTTATCLSTGWSTLNTDCNDLNPDIHPNAVEYCDGFDNNCDLDTDDVEQLYDGTLAYPDLASALGNGATDLNLCGSADGTVIGGATVTVTGLGSSPVLKTYADPQALIVNGGGSLTLNQLSVIGDPAANVTVCIAGEAGAQLQFNDVLLAGCRNTSAPFKLQTSSSLVANDFEIRECEGDATGGIACDDCTITGSHLEFNANVSLVNAGALSVRGSSTIDLDRLWMTDNRANLLGGGLYVDGPSTVSIDALLAHTNEADQGSAVYLIDAGGGTPDLTARGVDIQANATGLPSAGALDFDRARVTLLSGRISSNTRGFALRSSRGSVELDAITVDANELGLSIEGGDRLTMTNTTLDAPMAGVPLLTITDAAASASGSTVTGRNGMVHLRTAAASWCFTGTAHVSTPPTERDLRFDSGGTIDLSAVTSATCAAGTCTPTLTCP